MQVLSPDVGVVGIVPKTPEPPCRGWLIMNTAEKQMGNRDPCSLAFTSTETQVYISQSFYWTGSLME